MHPASKWFLYGDPGVGKSHAAATWPKPMLVFMFDPPGKDTAYLLQGHTSGMFLDDQGTPWQHVWAGEPEQSECLVTLGYFFDLNPTRPEFRMRASAYERFAGILAGVKYDDYATVVLDSLSAFRDAVVRVNQYKLNSHSKGGAVADGRQWYGAASQAIRSEIMSTMCYWVGTNVVVTAHVSKDLDNVRGTMLYGYAAPGQLKSDIGSTFAEVYYTYPETTGKPGERAMTAHFQTMPGDGYSAQTHIGARDGCLASYEALWVGARVS